MADNLSLKRNISVDVLRGIAILLVVLGHTMTGTTTDAVSGVLYNIIWSLQIPLFFIISGYVTRYSRSVNTVKELGLFLRKRTVSYMLPWVVWTYLVRVIILGQRDMLDIKFFAYNIDIGYWFLFSIWISVIIFGISQWLANVVCKSASGNKEVKTVVLTLVFCFAGLMALLIVGVILGIGFLGIKFVLLYMPFYLIGYLYGKLQDKFFTLKHSNNIAEAVVAVALVLYLVIIINVSLYSMSNAPLEMVIRLSCSLTGCVAVIGIIPKCINGGIVSRFLAWSGKHSLEIYVIHSVLLVLTDIEKDPPFTSVEGIALVFVKYLVIVAGCVVFVKLTSKNKWLNFVLFAKKQ